MNPMVAAAIGSIVRKGLAVLAGILVARGIWTQGDAETYIGAAVIWLTTQGWDLFVMYWRRRKLVAALATPAVISERQVEKLIENNSATSPPVSLRKNRIPYPIGQKRGFGGQDRDPNGPADPNQPASKSDYTPGVTG